MWSSAVTVELQGEGPKRGRGTQDTAAERGTGERGQVFPGRGFQSLAGSPVLGLPSTSPLCSDNHILRMALQSWLLASPLANLGKPAPQDLALSLYLLIKALSMLLFVLPTHSSTIYKAFLSVSNRTDKSG